MANSFNISDAAKIVEDAVNGYSNLKAGALVVIRERLGYVDENSGYGYVVSDGVRSYIVYASHLELLIDVTNTPSEEVV